MKPIHNKETAVVKSKTDLLVCLGILGIGILCCSCSSVSGARDSSPAVSKGSRPPVSYPAVRFAVMSDLHLYSSDLGTQGAAFQTDLMKDRKLLVETPALLDAAIRKINALPVDFVLITGDLTKDGEALNHKIVADKLRLLTRNGKKVFVINGNHDLRNGDARRYSATGEQAVPSVTPAEFAAIYREHGYGAALARDPHSMSYVAEPVDGLWILALDSCRHQDNKPAMASETTGRFTPETLAWIKQRLDQAKAEGKAVIGMMHHGVLEHYQGNRKYYPEYVVDNHESVSRMFAANGMNLVFTGHFHAQDTQGISLWGRLIMSLKKNLLKGWQQDLPPADNELAVDLKTGRPIRQTPRRR